jgi:phospholipid-translocating ATPase
MASNDHGEAPKEGGLRRRRSTHHDEDGTMVDEPETTSRDEFCPPKRTASEPIHGLLRSDSDYSNTPRVRFSTNIERSIDPTKTNDGEREAGKTTGHGAQERNTSENVLRMAQDGPDSAQMHSALGVKSSNLPDLSNAPRSKSRNRGYSLRRSLFNRNTQNQSEEDGTVIELEQASSSRRPLFITNQVPLFDNLKNGTTVTISPAIKEDDLSLTPETSKPGMFLSSLPNYENWIQKRRSKNGAMTKLKVVLTQARRRILRITEIPPSKDGRHIDLDATRVSPLTDERTNKPYISNTIRSSRYTFWNFFPRQLFAQFSKLANFYFLCVSILQMIPNLSTTGRYTTILPLLFFVALSMSKEGYDDLRRYRLDKEENNRMASVFRPSPAASQSDEGDSEASASWAETKWQDIKVGDILKLERDQAFPADVALLHADGPNGAAYIETMALDGETNLKSKQPSPPLAKRCKSNNGLARTQAHFVLEDPNIDLYKFEGKVTVGKETLPLTNNEIIYRGSVLRNTNQVAGMVIYSGEECKIRMNANKNPRIKAPALQTVVNRVVIIIVCFVIALSIFNTVAYQIWSENVEDKAWYLTNAGVAFFPILASFIIMFNTMIPLSLYVSLEIIKLAQMFLMNDIDMYDEESNTPMEPRTSTINEELGQVRYFFAVNIIC